MEIRDLKIKESSYPYPYQFANTHHGRGRGLPGLYPSTKSQEAVTASIVEGNVTLYCERLVGEWGCARVKIDMGDEKMSFGGGAYGTLTKDMRALLEEAYQAEVKKNSPTGALESRLEEVEKRLDALEKIKKVR